MPYFKWVGVTITGEMKQGKLVAYSSGELSERLFLRGIALLRFSSVTIIPFFWKITVAIKAQVFFSIARLLHAGIIIPDVFIIAAQQLNNPFLYDALFTWACDIKNGVSFTDTVKKQQLLCDPLVMTMLIAGHESSNVVHAVENIAFYYQRRKEFRKNVRSALAMPLLTFIFFIGITTFIFVFIIPRFTDMFLSMNSELPKLTRFMMQASSFITSWAMAQLLFILFIVGMGMCRYLGDMGLLLRNKICMSLPFFGTLAWHQECGQFLYALSLLINSNVPLLQALETLQASTHNYLVKHYIHVLCLDVQSGTLLSQAMSGLLVFPSDVVALVEIGEQSGTLGNSLVFAADLCRDAAQHLLSRLVFFIQPIVIIILGILIGMLIFAVYLPIMNLSYSI